MRSLELSERPDLAANPASIASVEQALEIAGKGMDDIAHIDFYSCFAIPVFNQCDHFGLAIDDPRGLTLTGGLPFFGGAGNNYSAHAIVEAVGRVRADRGKFALVGANGGWMSKYATGIYSTEPADWSANDRYLVVPNSQYKAIVSNAPFETATVETYTFLTTNKGSRAIFFGRNERGERVMGNGDMEHEPTRALFESGEPFGSLLNIERRENGLNLGRVA